MASLFPESPFRSPAVLEGPEEESSATANPSIHGDHKEPRPVTKSQPPPPAGWQIATQVQHSANQPTMAFHS
ncbi:hypothetical protein CFAM422_000529 [Trichoderma lentiforme]|uniref:Uncharacterized protein n=1 Tax=Trichoderma lentiforme TaxID=1567552 RepID=A0A9P4XS78_9HYPO|nr:hypothetical protein CFAM422_000529 [Trichoderma lentiforme]